MLRRSFLTAAALTAIAGCATTGTTLPTVASDVALIDGGLAAEWPVIAAAIPGISAAVSATVTQALGAIHTVAASLGSVAPTASQAAQIETAVTAIANVVLPLVGLPPGAATAIQAALALVPVILSAAGLTAGPKTPMPVMPAAAARLILAAPAK